MNPEQYARRSTDPIPLPKVIDLTERHGSSRAIFLWELIDRDYRAEPDERGFEVTAPMCLD